MNRTRGPSEPQGGYLFRAFFFVVLLFFTLSFSILLLGRKDACARFWVRRVRARLSFWAICIRLGARRAFVTGCKKKLQVFFLDCCEQPFARRDRVGPGTLLAPARRRVPNWSWRLWGCVRETGRTARPASAWAAAAVNEGKNDTSRAFIYARATTYLVII